MKNTILFLACLLWSVIAIAQDTFSIAAVDPVTGEVGSAGASCLDDIGFPGSNGAIIISDVKPGKGVIHTQSFWLAQNQQAASNRMDLGQSPEDILAWLQQNDAQGNPAIRQYGIADLDDEMMPRAAAFTGAECFDYKGDIVGTNYAIQGNILLGPQILTDMEEAFLNTEGDLATKLMASLQAANVVGADTRCTDNGTSSLSAFIRVAKPDDEPGALWLDLNVPSLPTGMEPIDSVQTLFDEFMAISSTHAPASADPIRIFPNPSRGLFTLERTDGAFETGAQLQIFDMHGGLLHQQAIVGARVRIEPERFIGSQMVWVKVSAPDGTKWVQRLVILP